MKTLLYLILSFLMLNIFISCNKDKVNPDDNQDLTLEERMNKFTAQVMKDLYLWADKVNDENISIQQSPNDFFEAIKYKEDNWSYLEENESTTKASSEGTETSFGYRIQFYKLGDNIVMGMILFVYPNSPAAKSGLKRGDMIVKNNNEWLDENNYKNVITGSTAKLQTGILTQTQIIAHNEVFDLQTSPIELEPILLDTVLQIDNSNKKIGYLVYTSFIDNESNSLSDLSRAIGRLKEAQIDEFILDLRYNSGGMSTAAGWLGSLLAPESAVRQNALLINKQWNVTYQEKYKNNPTALEQHFDSKALPDNLNLQKIYIFTGTNTASASEVVISGLRPYIPNIILIGEKTAGKYAGMSKVTPEKELQKWTLWPVTFTYTNANGENVQGGITPDYTIKEYTDYLPPFGDTDDPLLGKAIELITGHTVTTTVKSKSASSATINWKPLKNTEKHLLID